MIYYQAVCRRHDYKSSLYKRRSDAVRSARTHRRDVAGVHTLIILEIYIPASSMEIKSENSIN